MKQYFKLYMLFLSLNLSRMLAYKATFINELVNAVIWGTFSIISVLLLTSGRSSSVYGWSRGELLILTASFGLIWGVFHTFFIRNFQNIAFIIDKGTIDSFLLKPIDSQFMTTTSVINYPSLIRVFINLILILVFIHIYGIQIGLLQILGYIMLSGFGVVILYTVFFMAATILIWNPRLDNLLEVMYTVTAFSRYPPQMFYKLPLFILLGILPLTFAVVSPTKILLNTVLSGDIWGLVISAIIMFLISRYFWFYALRHYTSASG